MRVVTKEDLLNPGFVDWMMEHHEDHGVLVVEFPDGSRVKMDARMFIFNRLCWEPNIALGVYPTRQDITKIVSLTSDSINEIQTKLYDKALDALPDCKHMMIVSLYQQNIDRISNFIRRYLGEYMPSIDVLGIAQFMFNNPETRAMLDFEFDPTSTVVEQEAMFCKNSELLNKCLENPNMKDNCLLPYKKSGCLKANQVPQCLLAYGSRSDVDNTIFKHPISGSSFRGIHSAADYAIESTAAKVAAYNSKIVITDTQYFARKLRLLTSTIRKIYPGSCGSPGYIMFRIPSYHSKNWEHRIVIEDDGTRTILTKANIKDYVDRPVRLASVFACRHTDGICEKCAGYGKDRLSKYMPPDIHIGLLASIMMAELISQRILSTKHTMGTSSISYELPPEAALYFYVDKDTVKVIPEQLQNIRKCRMRISQDALLQITALSSIRLPNAETFSTITYIGLVRPDGSEEIIPFKTEQITPYLSQDMLEYLKTRYKTMTINDDERYIEVPLNRVDLSTAILEYKTISDDMNAFSKRVEGFLQSNIANYTDVAQAIGDFTDLVYQKISSNSFFIEVILRALTISGSEEEVSIPLMVDQHNVKFGKLQDVISNRSISTKLAFENVADYLRRPTTTLIPRELGFFAPLFGLY